MYTKTEIVLISSPVTYLKYILASSIVKASLYDNALHQVIQSLERISTLTVSLFNTQFAIDEDKCAVYVAPSIIGQYVQFVYYSEGAENPFYASSNLNAFITQVLKWTSNRISEGIYLTGSECNCDYLRTIQPGSFVYEDQFYVYHGESFDIRIQSPPTIVNQFKAYYLFINQEIIETYLNNQEKILNRLGVITSSAMHDDNGSAKLDVLALYDNMYNSTPLQVAFVYIMLSDAMSYDVWIDYPSGSRTL